jgi:parvulin-like peptidyl-prolyl isomerase
MRFRLQIAFVLLLSAVCSSQVVDRMVAVVNKRVILESELDQAARVELLMQGKPLGNLTAAEKLAVLDRLIDRSLLEQQMMHAEMLDPTSEELAARVAEIRRQIAGAESDEGWKNVLNQYALTQQDIEDSLSSQFRILRFVDLRFRGLVRVDRNAIETYYRDKLVPQLRAQGAPEPRLSDVSGSIEKVLAEQSIDEMLTRWLDTLRGQAHIEKMISAPATASSGDRP